MVVGARAGPGTARCFGVSFPLQTRSEREQAEEGAELLLRGPLRSSTPTSPQAQRCDRVISQERGASLHERSAEGALLFPQNAHFDARTGLGSNSLGHLKIAAYVIVSVLPLFSFLLFVFPLASSTALLPRRPPYSSRVPTHLCRRWAAAFCRSEVSRSLSTHNTNAAGFQQCCF